MDLSVVEFKESGRNVRYLTDSNKIRNFDIDSPKAVDSNKKYDVKWQQSFHGDDDQNSHDGYFPAKILLVGATIDEIRLKAAEKKIKNIQNLPRDDAQPRTQMKQGNVKEKKRNSRMDRSAAESSAKRRRMQKTLDEVSKVEHLSPSKKLKFEVSPFKSSLVCLPSKSESREPNHQICTPMKSDSFYLPKTNSFSPNLDTVDDDDDNLDVTIPVGSDDENGDSQVDLKSDDGSQAGSAEGPSEDGIPPKKPSTNFDDTQSEDGSVSGSSGSDDAAVLLDRLQKEHEVCKEKIKSLQRRVQHLQNEAAGLRFSAQKYRDELNSMKAINLKLQQQLFLPSSGNKNDKSHSSQSPKESRMKDEHSKKNQDSNSSGKRESVKDSWSTNNKKEGIKDKKRSDTEASKEDIKVRRTLFDSNTTVGKFSDDYESEEESIIERISKDLKNIERMPVVDGKVYLGSGQSINEKAWNDKVRKQSQDTIMVKDLAQAIYGKEKLATRTTGKPVAGKTVATPKKVRLITGALKGKLNARGASEREVDLIVKKVPQWLGQKFYDSSRVKTPSGKKADPISKREAELLKREAELKAREAALEKDKNYNE